MLVSHRFKFIYTKTAKTGGTSVEAYFERFCMHDGEWEPRHAREPYESEAGIIGYRGPGTGEKRKWWNHMPAWLIKERLGDEIWNSYFKFCVIRNPYDRCISAFEFSGRNYKVDGKLGPLFKFSNRGLTPEQQRFLHYLKHKKARLDRPPGDRSRYTIDGKLCMDDVVRYENMAADVERICHRLGLPWEPEMLPTYKVGKRRKEATVANLYSPKAKQLIERAYRFELDTFNYTFPES